MVLPLWCSHYSLGKSLLTLDKPEEEISNGPRSIFKILQENNLKELVLVEDNMSGSMRALKTSKDLGIDLFFGLKLVVCRNSADKSTESFNSEHSIIIFAKNDNGFKRLIKLYSTAATEGFYYKPRLDYRVIRKFWQDDELFLAHPYYNSFLHRNFLYFASCIPEDLGGNNFFVESNDLPFNYLIDKAIDTYSQDRPVRRIQAKSIYYKSGSDFKAYITNRALHERSTLTCPNVDDLSSNSFCFESWLNECN